MRMTWLPDMLRAEGLTVVEHDGWRSRGGDMLRAFGVVAHHTVTPARMSDQAVCDLLIKGHPGLRGPLAQLGLDRSGRYHVISDGRCHHNGYGLWGNESVGIEAFNDGRGETWPKAQLAAFDVGAAAILRRLRLPSDRLLGHRETDPKRKVDPVGIDMEAMRRRVQQLLDPPAPPEEDAMKIGLKAGEVQQLQRDLNALGAEPPLVEDGHFGPATERAVRDQQIRWGYTAHGAADSVFLIRALRELLKQPAR